jgi:hypothetical protein
MASKARSGQHGEGWRGGFTAGSGRREPKRKTYFPRRCDRHTGWMARSGNFGLRGRHGRAENQKKEISELKIGFLNLSRLWKFVEGDLGGILT